MYNVSSKVRVGDMHSSFLQKISVSIVGYLKKNVYFCTNKNEYKNQIINLPIYEKFRTESIMESI